MKTKTNFDGIKDRKAKWSSEVVSYENKSIDTGICKCVLITLGIFIGTIIILFPDQIINFFTK